MMMITVPDNFSTIRNFPKELLTRLRKEFEIDGITLEGDANISIFPYDNDTFVLYNYVTSWANDSVVTLRIKNAKKLTFFKKPMWGPSEILPYAQEGEYAVFKLLSPVGKFDGYKIER
jgi:hypothetical protein